MTVGTLGLGETLGQLLIMNLTGGFLLDTNYTNLSLNITSELDSKPVNQLLATDIVGIWLTGICCIIGLAGNILSFLVLLRAHSHSPMFYVLRAVAVSDAIFLLSVFLLQTLVNIYPVTGLCKIWNTYRGYIQYSIWPILMMTQMTTVWLTIFVSIERYIAICHPFQSASICTISNVRRAVISIYLGSIIYNVPRFFEYIVPEPDNMVTSDVGQHVIYRILYKATLYSLILFFIPLISLIFLNAKLVFALQKGKKMWNTLQFRQKKEQNLTIIPLTIVLVFFICGMPALVINVIDAFYPEVGQSTTFILSMNVANLLVVLNSACNFIIYCLLGKKFRTKLIEMCQCKCHTYRIVYTSHRYTETQISDV